MVTKQKKAAPAVSYVGQVKTPGDKEWVGNALRFATHAEAEAYVKDLAWRWTQVRETNVAPTQDPVTSVWKDGKVLDVPKVIDVTVDNQGTIVALTLNTDAALAWVEENVGSESWQWLGERTLCVEPRYAHDLVDGLLAADLTVGV